MQNFSNTPKYSLPSEYTPPADVTTVPPFVTIDQCSLLFSFDKYMSLLEISNLKNI